MPPRDLAEELRVQPLGAAPEDQHPAMRPVQWLQVLRLHPQRSSFGEEHEPAATLLHEARRQTVLPRAARRRRGGAEFHRLALCHVALAVATGCGLHRGQLQGGLQAPGHRPARRAAQHDAAGDVVVLRGPAAVVRDLDVHDGVAVLAPRLGHGPGEVRPARGPVQRPPEVHPEDAVLDDVRPGSLQHQVRGHAQGGQSLLQLPLLDALEGAGRRDAEAVPAQRLAESVQLLLRAEREVRAVRGVLVHMNDEVHAPDPMLVPRHFPHLDGHLWQPGLQLLAEGALRPDDAALLTRAATSGPVKDSMSARLEGGARVNSARQTLHVWWRTSSSQNAGSVGWPTTTMRCHRRRQLRCTYFWPPVHLQGEMSSPSSRPQKQ
mmetsp:Transcript_17691/g.55771  ORF Transcript_17691/g.55771 Transcript_17691/m.55771 type:complete len:378 (+) Transcript_17691:281-1414(+)